MHDIFISVFYFFNVLMSLLFNGFICSPLPRLVNVLANQSKGDFFIFVNAACIA